MTGNWASWESRAVAQPVDPEHVADAFQGWKVVRTTITSQRQLLTLSALGAEALSCHGPVVGVVDYALPGDALADLTKAGIQHVVLVDDLEAAIETERASIEAHNQQRGLGWFADYKTYDQIGSYVNELVALRPDLARRESVGQSLENRELFAIRITSPVGTDKPIVFLHSLQHAREWVTGMTSMYIADRLVRTYDSDPAITAFLDHYEVVIVPVSNPDGYVHTWTPNNRLWRKNRRPNGDGTFGVDINRNWGYQWGALPQGGSSGSTNSETYRGSAPFSEPETQALRDYVIANPRMLMHVDIHSYSQLILSPWGYTDAAPPDAPLFDTLNAGFAQAIFDVHSMPYVAGPTFTTIYPANGVSDDWTYGERGILGWGVECRDTGQTGFQLPAAQILPNAEEMWAGIFWTADWLRTNAILITVPGGVPGYVVSDEPTPIGVAVTRAGGFPDTASVRLFSRIGPAGSFAESALPAGASPNTYAATLPATPCGEELQFYFQAATMTGQTLTLPPAGPDAPFVVTAADTAVALDDDCETDRGWTAGAPGDTATSGQWTRGNPIGTSAQPEDDHTPDPGVNCYFTGQGTVNGGAGQADVDGGFTTLITPRLDLDGASATVGYWRWYSNSAGSAPNADVFTVDVSNNDGSTWTRAETVGPAGPETSGGWFYHEFIVNDFVAPTSQVRVRFRAEDAGQGSLVEAAIDDFRAVVTSPCPEPMCPADWNGSGVVNSQDFFDFLAAFFKNSADFNHNGVTDSQDFFDFLTAFFNGC